MFGAGKAAPKQDSQRILPNEATALFSSPAAAPLDGGEAAPSEFTRLIKTPPPVADDNAGLPGPATEKKGGVSPILILFGILLVLAIIVVVVLLLMKK